MRADRSGRLHTVTLLIRVKREGVSAYSDATVVAECHSIAIVSRLLSPVRFELPASR